MAGPKNNAKHILGSIIFETSHVIRAVHGLHAPDSGDISLQLSLAQSSRGPCLRLAAKFTTDVIDVAIEDSDYEICFDISVADIQHAGVLLPEEPREALPKLLVNNSEVFRQYYSLDMLERLEVVLTQPLVATHPHVAGFVRAYHRAKPAQKSVLWDLGHILYAKEFIFYSKREGSMLHDLVTSMDRV